MPARARGAHHVAPLTRMRTLQSKGNEALPAELSPWFHNLHLPDGTQTAPDHPLGDFPRWKWEQIAPFLPEDLHGARVLDIGCNAGFYSFELARRGADVLAVDIDERYLAQARWASDVFGLSERIELRRTGVYDLARLGQETFDVVLLLGVLYHLRHPLLALDIVAELTRETLVLQTLTMPGEERLSTPADLGLEQRSRMRAPGWPSMAFIEHRLAGDPTNWWAPDAIGHETGASGVSVAPRWLAGTWRALARVPADVALVSLEIVAQAVRPGRPRGTLRALPFAFGGPESSRDVGRRALAEGLGSLAPNTIVIGIDPERDLLLAHQLR